MKKISMIILVIIAVSCAKSEKYEKIKGEWTCTSWTSEGSDVNKCRDNVYFKFNEDKTYISKIGNLKDSGTYKIMNNLLYANPKGKMQIAVQIIQLQADTLGLLMNQAGTKEQLILVKKQ